MTPRKYLLALLLPFFIASTTLSADCDRGCLLGIVNDCLDAMVKHDVTGLPFATGLRSTENGRPAKPGEGLWQTAEAIVYRHTVVDPSTGQAIFFGVAQEAEGEALFVLRLAVADERITELEALVARDGAHPIFNPTALRSVKPIWLTTVPEDERSTREELIAIADSYFEAIEKNRGDLAPFHPDCNRTENGVQTTNNPDSEFMRTSASYGIDNFTYIEKVRGRRYPIVDEARGLVVAIVHFDVPGQATSVTPGDATGTTLSTTTRTLLLYELFKIESGRIREIQAFMANAPLGASNGWED